MIVVNPKERCTGDKILGELKMHHTALKIHYAFKCIEKGDNAKFLRICSKEFLSNAQGFPLHCGLNLVFSENHFIMQKQACITNLLHALCSLGLHELTRNVHHLYLKYSIVIMQNNIIHCAVLSKQYNMCELVITDFAFSCISVCETCVEHDCIEIYTKLVHSYWVNDANRMELAKYVISKHKIDYFSVLFQQHNPTNDLQTMLNHCYTFSFVPALLLFKKHYPDMKPTSAL